MSGLMDEEWAVLRGLLPQDWRELAHDTGAIRRARGVAADAEVLLRMLLLHAAGGLSLRSAVVRGKELGIAEMSDVALMKRLRTSEQWLRTLAFKMFSKTRFESLTKALDGNRRFRAFDATTIEEPGATGTDWRVHFGLSLPDLQCDYYELTDSKGGEFFSRFPVQAGDVVLADRGYSHRRGVAYVLKSGADVVVRHNTGAFPLQGPCGKSRFNLLDNLRKTPALGAREWQVSFKYAKERYTVRLCAIRKTKAAAEIAKAKAQTAATKKGKSVRPETLEAAEYVIVLTSLPADEYSPGRILELYRARWQIELVFKRMKTLMKLGHLPKFNDESARAWIEGKLLSVLLVERLLGSARFFSPWGYDLEATQSLA